MTVPDCGIKVKINFKIDDIKEFKQLLKKKNNMNVNVMFAHIV